MKADGSPGHDPLPRRLDNIHFSRSMADILAALDDQFHANTAPNNTCMGQMGGSSSDGQADMPLKQASGATCIQKLDDSQNSAIHIMCHILLHSSLL